MLALTLGQAKAIGAVAAAVLVIGAIASAWLMKTIVQKVVVAAVLVAIAIGVWSQRASLDDCADDVRAAGLGGEATCTFFGADITISASTIS